MGLIQTIFCVLKSKRVVSTQYCLNDCSVLLWQDECGGYMAVTFEFCYGAYSCSSLD